MNRNRIEAGLVKNGVVWEWLWNEAGPYVHLVGYDWNCHVPLDDESDDRFVEFVTAEWRRRNGEKENSLGG